MFGMFVACYCFGRLRVAADKGRDNEQQTIEGADCLAGLTLSVVYSFMLGGG
jgi:hypothetical protein